MSTNLGMNAKLYVSATVVTQATVTPGSMTLLANTRDVTVNLETGQADITTRANNGWRQNAATLKDGTIEFVMNDVDSDAGLGIIETAWLANAEIAVAALNKASGEGPGGNFVITNFSRNEPLEEAVNYSVTLKPSSYNHWHTPA